MLFKVLVICWSEELSRGSQGSYFTCIVISFQMTMCMRSPGLVRQDHSMCKSPCFAGVGKTLRIWCCKLKNSLAAKCRIRTSDFPCRDVGLQTTQPPWHPEIFHFFFHPFLLHMAANKFKFVKLIYRHIKQCLQIYLFPSDFFQNQGTKEDLVSFVENFFLFSHPKIWTDFFNHSFHIRIMERNRVDTLKFV